MYGRPAEQQRKPSNWMLRAGVGLLFAVLIAEIGVLSNSFTPSDKGDVEYSNNEINGSGDSMEIDAERARRIKQKMRAAQKWNPSSYEAEVECLSKNIYFEARDQDITGQIAVGLVTINRVLSSKYPNTICEVVWQKRKHPETGNWVGQFSWTVDGKPDVPKNNKVWMEVRMVASAMLAGRTLLNFQDFTDGATHYHATYVKPKWRKSLTFITQIGDHIFYRDERATPISPVAKLQPDDL